METLILFIVLGLWPAACFVVGWCLGRSQPKAKAKPKTKK